LVGDIVIGGVGQLTGVDQETNFGAVKLAVDAINADEAC
jgi:hypothetical protein